MKPGATILFIDNAGGGFYELVSRAASRCGLANFSGPFRHMKYQSEVFKRKMFGFFSLSSTTVAVQMWQKPYPVTLNGWASQLRTIDSWSKTSNYGLGCPSGSLSLVGSLKVKQNISGRKCGNSVSVPTSNAHDDSLSCAKSKMYASSIQSFQPEAVLSSSVVSVTEDYSCSRKDEGCTDVYCEPSDDKLDMNTRGLQSSEVQAVPDPSLASVTERHFRNRRDEEYICCCIIL